MKVLNLILPIALCLGGCQPSIDEANHADQIDHAQHTDDANHAAPAEAPAAKKGGADYKKMFGPDYQPGDIGHSTGTVESINAGGNTITIAHGMIHGIGGQPGATTFDVPQGVAMNGASNGSPVEFLVKKGPDADFRLFLICEIPASSAKCLDAIMGE